MIVLEAWIREDLEIFLTFTDDFIYISVACVSKGACTL